MKTKQQIVLRQIELQEKIQSVGFNIVECGNCGAVLLHECGDEEIDCFCGETMALSDCPDLYYSGMENINAEFESAQKVKNKTENLSSYLETHFDVVQYITDCLDNNLEYGNFTNAVSIRYYQQGSGGMYELAKEWSDKFTDQYKDVAWGEEIEYYGTIEEFLTQQNKL